MKKNKNSKTNQYNIKLINIIKRNIEKSNLNPVVKN